MKVHVADITVPDYNLVRDIVNALENCPLSGTSYDIEMRERPQVDIERNRPTDRMEYALRIHRLEIVT